MGASKLLALTLVALAAAAGGAWAARGQFRVCDKPTTALC
jgi:hypothetical protein